MNVKTKILGAAMGALGLCGLSSAALAGSTNPPGERAGLDLATPLPEGVYFVDIAGVGNWRDAVKGADSNFSYNVPIVAWSTPWNILGAHVQFLVAAPEPEQSRVGGDGHAAVGIALEVHIGIAVFIPLVGPAMVRLCLTILRMKIQRVRRKRVRVFAVIDVVVKRTDGKFAFIRDGDSCVVLVRHGEKTVERIGVAH